MSLRRYFQLVGWLMIAVGFLFWGYHWPMARYFGVETPDAFVDVRELDKALSFGGLFGGALMLYGLTCLGIAAIRDTRSSSPRRATAASGWRASRRGRRRSARRLAAGRRRWSA